MIGLNKIWLNQVQLNRLYLNAPFPVYRKMTGGGSSGDGFPVLPGDVTRWHFGGLTNEMMAAMDDPRIEDADGKGRFLSFKNFLWAGMSGVGGYNQNFNQWGYGNLNNATETHTSNKIELNVIDAGNRTGNIYSTLFPVGYIFDFNIKVTGLKDPCFILVSKGTTESIIKITNDGIYNVKATVDESWSQRRIYFIINHSGGSSFDGLVIEQLPLYPGFILGDGVDDFAVTEENFNFEKEFCVYLAAIFFPQDSPHNSAVLGKNPNKDVRVLQYSASLTFQSINTVNMNINSGLFSILAFKRTNDTLLIKDLTTGRSKSVVASSDVLDNPGKFYLWIASSFKDYCNAAIAGCVICNGHSTTDEEDEKVLNWHKKQYPWLFPDQAWTVVGKTNEDTDRATIANITGNGNNLVLSNLGFIEGSGYNEEGEYAGYLVTDGVDDGVTSSSFRLQHDFTVVGEWQFLPPDKSIYCGMSKGTSFILYNFQAGLMIFINQQRTGTELKGVKGLKAICSDGRVYNQNWDEIRIMSGELSFSDTRLQMGYTSDRFTNIAFKNLGIYNNKILSKEDCIKAYNYLQTLKAK